MENYTGKINTISNKMQLITTRLAFKKMVKGVQVEMKGL